MITADGSILALPQNPSPSHCSIGVKPIEVSVTKHEWKTLQYRNIAMKNEQFIDDLPKKMVILQFAM